MGMTRLRVAILFIAATSTARVVHCFVTPTGTAHRGICKLDLLPKEGPCRARCRPRSAASTEVNEALLPPKDDTFGLAASVREVLTAPEVPEGADRYDRFGGQTGGIWRSRVIGFIPSTAFFDASHTANASDEPVQV